MALVWQTASGKRIPLHELSDPHLAHIVNHMLQKARGQARNDSEALDCCARHPLWKYLVDEVFVRRIEQRTTLPVHYELIAKR